MADTGSTPILSPYISDSCLHPESVLVTATGQKATALVSCGYEGPMSR